MALTLQRPCIDSNQAQNVSEILTMAAERFLIGWILKILLWCLIIGVVLSALGVTAGDFWNSLWGAVNRVYEWGV